MVIVLEKNIRDEDKQRIRVFLEKNSLRVNEIAGDEETIIGAVGKVGIDPREVEILPGVQRVIPISKPYKMASREFKRDNTVVNVRGVKIGGNRVTVIAGPCAVESREQIMESAARVAESGAVMLRGGAYKPRTSPYAFQGLGEEGVKYLREAGDAWGLPVVTEIVSSDAIPAMRDYVDVYQIGARNMQNFELLKKVGALGKPVILKRGLSATIEEWLMAAEYLLSSGTEDVILCERGIRTYEGDAIRSIFPPSRFSARYNPSAHHSRSESRGRRTRQGSAIIARSHCRRRRRSHRRSASDTEQGAFRRSAVPLSRPVRKDDAGYRIARARGGPRRVRRSIPRTGSVPVLPVLSAGGQPRPADCLRLFRRPRRTPNEYPPLL